MSGTIGDNVYRASGVIASAAGGGTSWQSVETGPTMTAVAGNGYPVNTTAQACTVTLPAGSVGDTIEFVDYAGTWDTNKVRITADGSEKIKGSTDDAEFTAERQGVKIVYVDATQGWVATTGVNETVPALNPPSYNVDFLCIAGGAGGGGSAYGGGGGAGGYRNSYNSETSGGGSASETAASLLEGTQYTITVGAGGPASTVATQGNAGVDSSISGTGFTTITSAGGGGGGEQTTDGSDGGSGGGAGAWDGSGPSDAGGAGTADQGYAGGVAGIGVGAGANSGTGGGGGAGVVGGAGSGTTAGSGGNGLASSITASAVTRAGGGGGSAYYGSDPGANGGTGGGGEGGWKNDAGSPSTAGAVNTGSGGGAPSATAVGEGAAGGSGVVILRMATASYTGTYTNAETPIVDGTDTILVFNAAGTYTA